MIRVDARIELAQIALTAIWASCLRIWHSRIRSRTTALSHITGALQRKHLTQRVEYSLTCLLGCFAETFDQANFVHGTYLIKGNLTVFFIEADGNARGVRTPGCCHRGGDDGSKSIVHFIRR